MRKGRKWNIRTAALLALALSASAVSAAGYDDYAQGLTAINEGDNDRAIAQFTAALAAGDLNANLVPIAYFDRARAYLSKHECALAVSDLTASLKLKPDYLDVYMIRAHAEQCVDDGAAALADLTQLIALKPSYDAYWARGHLRWNAGDFAGAASDFASTEASAPKPSAIVVLWLAMSRLRAGTFDAHAMAEDFSAVDSDDWPGPIVDLYRGKSTPDDVARAAGQGDAASIAKQQCEANFFTAEWWLAQQNIDAAKPLLEDARANCPHNIIAYVASNIELKRLK